MALGYDYTDYIKQTGFNPDLVDIPSTADEATAASLRLFIRGDAAEDSSVGFLHVTGPSVAGHTAPARAVGELLSSFQKAVDAVGASIQGVTSLGASIPTALLRRTELSVVASPIPGSVVIEIMPTMSRELDFRPAMSALFQVEDVSDARPLADMAVGKLIDAVGSYNPTEPAGQAFLDNLSELGPRASSAMKGLCASIGNGGFDLDVKWKEPKRSERRVSVSNDNAKSMVQVIQEASTIVEDVEIVGTLETNTNSVKDRLRIKMDDGSEALVSLGDIETSSLVDVYLGQRVRVKAVRQTSKRPGGREGTNLMGVSIVSEGRLV